MTDIHAKADMNTALPPHTRVSLRDRIHGVPVKHNGQVVGHADIDEDGVIHATIDSNLLKDELRETILFGYSDSISISPNYVPAIRRQHNGSPETPRGDG